MEIADKYREALRGGFRGGARIILLTSGRRGDEKKYETNQTCGQQFIYAEFFINHFIPP
jgi:hypothetical protein